ncbi:MAG: anthrax toxin-like adenylyl cyclase domain-containing protein [Opitutaceae bacterium]
MITGISAITLTGMPESHGRAFQEAANQAKCVIASREVGKWATGLLLEGYATKGFHNKAKSCPWGPMAGFVMADPRFSKNSDIAGQRGGLQKAIASGGGETPLYITEERRKDLEGPLARITRSGGTNDEIVYTSPGPTGALMKFVLRRTNNAPGADGKVLWAVLYEGGEVRLSNNLTSPNQSGGDNLMPVMAMVDPGCSGAIRSTYRAATTGDYDLWAVFPQRKDYSRSGADKRMVPGSDRFKEGIKAYIDHEDKNTGNMTPRIASICQDLNARVRAAGYTGGDVVHHSDEAGRPMVSDIDFPFVAFIPDRPAVCVQDVCELKEFLASLSFEFVLSLNPGWHQQLGIGVSAGGSYEV